MPDPERKELVEALGTLLDLIQLARILDHAKLSENDMKDFLWAKGVHSRAILPK